MRSFEVEIDIVGPQGVATNDYEFRISVPESTGVYIGSKRNEECDYSSLPTSRTTTLQSAATPVYLVRCKRGDGNSAITIESYHVSGTPVANSFGSWTVPQARHYQNSRVPYRLCNTPTPTPVPSRTPVTLSPTPTAVPELDYNQAFSLGAGEWNSRSSGMTILRHSGACDDSPTVKMVSAYFVDTHPCSNSGALGCVEPISRSSTSPQFIIAQKMEIRVKPPVRKWTMDINETLDMFRYLPGVISHEFGHNAGLGHSSRNTDLMYYTYTVRVPTTNDVNAMEALYR